MTSEVGTAPAAMVAEPEPFAHPALFYRGDEGFLAGTVPFVEAGLAAGEPVAVAVPAGHLALLRGALGARAGQVRFLDMAVVGRNPGRIIPRVLGAFADSHLGGTRLRIIGEPIWPGRSAVEYPACVQHEALINDAFTGRPVTILCPYDEDGLTAGVLADAYTTHPVVIVDGTERRSAGYAPQRGVAAGNEPLRCPPEAAAFDFDSDALPGVRLFAVERAGRLGLTGGRLDDLALVVAELTTNSVLHGGGTGTLRIWAEGGQVVCEVADRGELRDPLAGRRAPAGDQPGGRGLLLVHCLADLVRTHTGRDGTTVRCYLGGALD